MTTIAYHHKTRTIAYDSRLTRGTLIVTDEAEKKLEKNGRIFFLSGSVHDCEHIVKTYPQNADFNDLEAGGFMVEDGVVYWMSYDGITPNPFEIEFNEAVGSGCDFAIAAMDFGNEATEAVSYAATKDSATGGEIKTFRVK